MTTKFLLAGAALAALTLAACGKKEEAPASDTAPAAEAPAADAAAPADDASTIGDDRGAPGNDGMRAADGAENPNATAVGEQAQR